MATVAKTDNYNTSRNVSCVTVIPSMRDEDKDKFVQGIENLLIQCKEKSLPLFL